MVSDWYIQFQLLYGFPVAQLLRILRIDDHIVFTSLAIALRKIKGFLPVKYFPYFLALKSVHL